MALTILALGLAVAGAATAAYTAYQAAQSQQQQLKVQAQIQEDDARVTRQAGEAAAARQRKKDEARLNMFGSRAGAAGVVAHEGSSLMAEMDFATEAEVEAQHIQYGYGLEARRKSIGAELSRWGAGRISPGRQAVLTGGSSLLSSVGSIAGNYSGGVQPQSGGGLTPAASDNYGQAAETGRSGSRAYAPAPTYKG